MQRLGLCSFIEKKNIEKKPYEFKSLIFFMRKLEALIIFTQIEKR
jgi:hypothetical protein